MNIMIKTTILLTVLMGIGVLTSCSKDKNCVCTTTAFSGTPAPFEESEGTGLSEAECNAHDASNALATKDCELE